MKYHIVVLAVCTAAAGNAQSGWKAGAAKVDVTPNESIWLSGYGNRSKPSEGVLQPIFVKAAAFEDASGTRSVLVTSDLQGFDVEMINQIALAAQHQFHLSREGLVLNYSHNHSAPVTGLVLHLYYNLSPTDNPQV